MSRLIFTDLNAAGADTDPSAGQLYLKGDKLCFKRADNQETNLIELSGGKVAFGVDGYGSLEQDSSTVRYKNSTTGEVHLMTHDGNEDINLNHSGYIQFETAGVEAMRINSSQCVGIGTASPNTSYPISKLHISTGVNTTRDNMLFGLTTGTICISAVPIAKAWGNIDGTGTANIRRSYNISSITDGGTGNYRINFNEPMTSWDYCVVLGSNRLGSSTGSNASALEFHNNDANGFSIITNNTNSTNVDHDQVCFSVYSD